MKKQQTIAIIFAVMGLVALSIPAVMLTRAATDTFSVSLVVSNNLPTIYWVNNSFSITPQTNLTTYGVQFKFNVTDADGAAGINDTTAKVIITLGSQSATSTACTPTDNGNDVEYNCSVYIPYYFNQSAAWQINASVNDTEGAKAQNYSTTFTVNELRAMSVRHNSLSFAGNPGSTDVLATEGAQIVWNTGNYDFVELNLTGIELNSSANEKIGATNFTVNVTASGGPGQILYNDTAVVIANHDLTHGYEANETLYIYLDIPLGTTPDTYTSEADWTVSAN